MLLEGQTLQADLTQTKLKLDEYKTKLLDGAARDVLNTDRRRAAEAAQKKAEDDVIKLRRQIATAPTSAATPVDRADRLSTLRAEVAQVEERCTDLEDRNRILEGRAKK